MACQQLLPCGEDVNDIGIIHWVKGHVTLSMRLCACTNTVY